EWLRIPSVSTDPRHKEDTRKAAEWCANHLKLSGFDAQVRPASDGHGKEGHPIVMAHSPGAAEYKGPHVLFYGHYDVQPVDPVNLWESPPFEATVRDGEIYARGSADDKGQVFMHLKAIEAHMKQTGKLPVNIRVIVEGEEEVGSVNLDPFIRSHKHELSADVVVISDSAMFDRGVPSICYGLRGLVYFQ